jgi:hypothetical protein
MINRNNTEIAPIYNNKIIKDKNCKLFNNNQNANKIKTKIKQNTLLIKYLQLITYKIKKNNKIKK